MCVHDWTVLEKIERKSWNFLQNLLKTLLPSVSLEMAKNRYFSYLLSQKLSSFVKFDFFVYFQKLCFKNIFFVITTKKIFLHHVGPYWNVSIEIRKPRFESYEQLLNNQFFFNFCVKKHFFKTWPDIGTFP